LSKNGGIYSSFLIVSYRDGYYVSNEQLHKDKLNPSLIEYPQRYLESIGFKELPRYIFPTGPVEPITHDGEVLPPEPDEDNAKNDALTQHVNSSNLQNTINYQSNDSYSQKMLSLLIYPLILITGIYIGIYLKTRFDRSTYSIIEEHNE